MAKASVKHWKRMSRPACGAKTGVATILCIDVTCAKCRRLVSDEWARLIEGFKKKA